MAAPQKTRLADLASTREQVEDVLTDKKAIDSCQYLTKEQRYYEMRSLHQIGTRRTPIAV